MSEPPLDLATIRARADAASKGPWSAEGRFVAQEVDPWSDVVSPQVNCMAYCYGGVGAGIELPADAEFIAAARSDVPALIAEVEILREENTWLRESMLKQMEHYEARLNIGGRVVVEESNAS